MSLEEFKNRADQMTAEEWLARARKVLADIYSGKLDLDAPTEKKFGHYTLRGIWNGEPEALSPAIWRAFPIESVPVISTPAGELNGPFQFAALLNGGFNGTDEQYEILVQSLTAQGATKLEFNVPI